MREFDDPELAELFRDDHELLDLARSAQDRDLDVPMGAHFQAYLRDRLMEEARQTLRPRGLARVGAALRSRSGMAAAFGGVAGAVMIAVAVVAFTQGGGGSGVQVPTANSPINWNPNVDPRTHAITIAFTQPMDQASVAKGLKIAPATSYSTTWNGNTLTITPTHGLSASTAYVVRIDNSVARSTAGQAPTAPIVVAFGTQPTPGPIVVPTTKPTPTAAPVLATTVLGPTGPAADVVPAPDGRVLVTDVASVPAAGSTSTSGQATSTPSAAPTSSPSPAGTSTAASGTSSTSTGTSTGSSTSRAAAPSGLVSFGPSGPAVVGATATAAAVSPTGRYVAAIQPGANGVADVVVENLDGTNPRQLAHADASSPVAWTSGSAVLFTSGGRLRSVDLQGGVRSAGGPNGLAVGDGRQLTLAPGGRWAYLGPAASAGSQTSSTAAAAAPGSLVDISSGASLPLPGSGAIVAFAPDSSVFAWVDSATPAQAHVQAITDQLPATAAPATVKPGSGGQAITALAVGSGGHFLAASVAAGNSSSSPAQVRAFDAGGHLLATDPENATRLAFTGDSAIALVAAGHAATATIPRGATQSPTPSASPPAVPTDAQGLLDRIVAAQTSSPASLSGLPVAGSLDLASLVPRGVTQGYVIAVQPGAAAGQVTASIRLVGIPRQGSADPVTFADETVTLDRVDGTNLVITKLTVTPLSPEPAGPHVVHVAAARAAGTMTVSVVFDSDLDPATVASAITLTGPVGISLPSHVTYDATTRTATMTVPLPGQLTDESQPLTLGVSTALHDVDGNALSKAYVTQVTG